MQTPTTNAYPEVLKVLARVIDGTPKVQTGEVVSSTFDHISAAVAAWQRKSLELSARESGVNVAFS
jgi:hypothetical protein